MRATATFRFITGDFRIQSWKLNKDYSVTITARTVVASMYDLDNGPKPQDVAPAPLPALFYAIPLGPAWAPYQIQAAASDALFPGEWTFDTNQSLRADGRRQHAGEPAGDRASCPRTRSVPASARRALEGSRGAARAARLWAGRRSG